MNLVALPTVAILVKKAIAICPDAQNKSFDSDIQQKRCLGR
ncbi:hypothetical protein [Nostoc sp.]